MQNESSIDDKIYIDDKNDSVLIHNNFVTEHFKNLGAEEEKYLNQRCPTYGSRAGPG